MIGDGVDIEEPGSSDMACLIVGLGNRRHAGQLKGTIDYDKIVVTEMI